MRQLVPLVSEAAAREGSEIRFEPAIPQCCQCRVYFGKGVPAVELDEARDHVAASMGVRVYVLCRAAKPAGERYNSQRVVSSGTIDCVCSSWKTEEKYHHLDWSSTSIGHSVQLIVRWMMRSLPAHGRHSSTLCEGDERRAGSPLVVFCGMDRMISKVRCDCCNCKSRAATRLGSCSLVTLQTRDILKSQAHSRSALPAKLKRFSSCSDSPPNLEA